MQVNVYEVTYPHPKIPNHFIQEGAFPLPLATIYRMGLVVPKEQIIKANEDVMWVIYEGQQIPGLSFVPTKSRFGEVRL